MKTLTFAAVSVALLALAIACGTPDKPPMMPDSTDPVEGIDGGATPPSSAAPAVPPAGQEGSGK